MMPKVCYKPEIFQFLFICTKGEGKIRRWHFLFVWLKCSCWVGRTNLLVGELHFSVELHCIACPPALCSLVTIFGWVYVLQHLGQRKDSIYRMLENSRSQAFLSQNSHVNLDWAFTSNCVLLDSCLGRKGYWESCLILAEDILQD